ncbi:MAG: magnesium transporter CorA family protein [Eubacteriales bacterium]|nr:magnesium transporter CorA family protein [Eubacteriales bacterium]
MIEFFISDGMQLSKTDLPASGGWINMVAPDEGEIQKIARRYRLDTAVIKYALDLDERSRIETDDDYTMILVNIPALEEDNHTELYTTIPLSIIVVDDVIITVCSEETQILRNFKEGMSRSFRSQMRSRFILQILYGMSVLFLNYLHVIDKKSEQVEDKLRKSTKNRELIEMLRLEKSLLYFTTALKSNEAVMKKLFRSELIRKYPEDSDLLEDVIVENEQAIEMANIYSGVLSGLMDAYASVISNNLNIVMKVLAIVTLVMSVPTMIFSAYGMNVNLAGMPFATHPNGFWIIIGFSLVISIIVSLIFSKTKLFK